MHIDIEFAPAERRANETDVAIRKATIAAGVNRKKVLTADTVKLSRDLFRKLNTRNGKVLTAAAAATPPTIMPKNFRRSMSKILT